MLRFVIAFVSIVDHLSLCTGQPAVEQQLQHQRHPINAEDLSFGIIHSNQKHEDSFGAEWIHLEEDELRSQGQAQCASTFSNKDEELKCRMASHMTGGESATNGVESVYGWQKQLVEGWTEKKSDKCLSEGASSPPAAKEVKPEKTSLRMLLERADVENAIEETNRDWREKVSKKQVAGMEKEFQRMELLRKKHLEKMDVVRPEPLSKTDFRKLLGAQFDPVMFRKDVDNNKPCDEEPLQVAEYYLFRYSNKMGLYHVGLLVCGIEIHFHLPGIEFGSQWSTVPVLLAEYTVTIAPFITKDARCTL